MASPRDPQRQRVYEAEEHYTDHGSGSAAVLHYPAAHELVAWIVSRPEFARRWPRAAEALNGPAEATWEQRGETAAWVPVTPEGSLAETGVRFTTHLSGDRAGAWGEKTISLNFDESPTEGVVVHELTHLVTANELGPDHEPHGPEFVRNLVDLVEITHGSLAAARLRQHLRDAGVRWATAAREPAERDESAAALGRADGPDPPQQPGPSVSPRYRPELG